jgi:hypothetical protein
MTLRHGSDPRTQPTPTRNEGAPTMTATREQIQERAYFLWEQRGRPNGSPEVDWDRAKQELEGEKEDKHTASWSRPTGA